MQLTFIFAMAFIVQPLIFGFFFTLPSLYIIAGINCCIRIINGLIQSINSNKSDSQVTASSQWFNKNFSNHNNAIIKINTHYIFTVLFVSSSVATILWVSWVSLGFRYLIVVWLFIVSWILNLPNILKAQLYFGKKLLFPKEFIATICIVIAISIVSMLGSVNRTYKLFAAFTAAGIVYLGVLRLFGVVKYYKMRRLGSVKFALWGSLITFVVAATSFASSLRHNYLINSQQTFIEFLALEIQDTLKLAKDNINSFVTHNFQFSPVAIPEETSALSWVFVVDQTWWLLSATGVQTNTWIANATWEIISGTEVGVNILAWSWTTTSWVMITWDSSSTQTGTSSVSWEPLSYRQVLPLLLKKYSIPFATTKPAVTFQYISYSDSSYPYFKASYYKKLVGKTVKPDSIMKCKTLIVMKGILEGRNVSYTSATVFDAFWAEAVKREALGSCGAQDDLVLSIE